MPVDRLVPFLPTLMWAPRGPTETLDIPFLPMFIFIPGAILIDFRNRHPIALLTP
jgi:hypothetical protein